MRGRILAFAAVAMLAAGRALAQGGGGPGPQDGAWVIAVFTLSAPCGSGFAGDYTSPAGGSSAASQA